MSSTSEDDKRELEPVPQSEWKGHEPKVAEAAIGALRDLEFVSVAGGNKHRNDLRAIQQAKRFFQAVADSKDGFGVRMHSKAAHLVKKFESIEERLEDEKELLELYEKMKDRMGHDF